MAPFDDDIYMTAYLVVIIMFYYLSLNNYEIFVNEIKC